MITPSNANRESKNRSFFKKYNSGGFHTINAKNDSIDASYNSQINDSTIQPDGHSGSKNSLDLKKQYLLQKKFDESLKQYPKNRYTSQEYDSVERPNSVSGTIKVRRSQDLIKYNTKNHHELEMYKLGQGSKSKLTSSRYSNQNFTQ